MKKTAIPILAALLACNIQSGKSKGIKKTINSSHYHWTKITDSAAFKKSYNFQLFAIKDTLWVMHSDAAWFSVDGKIWIKSSLTDIIDNNAFLDYVWFNNALYGLGTFNGNIEHYKLTSAIHKTTDMKNWQQIAAASNLPRRFFYHPFVFDNKIWIIGGGTENEMFADVWNSTNAVHWTKQADDLPFGKRQGSQFVFFNNKIYMLGNDVWSSTDAIHWTRETERIATEDVFGYAAVVFDNAIWLLGCNRNNIFKSEALRSMDGKLWETVKAPFSPRGGMAACVYKGKVYMTGGKYGGPGIAGQTEFIYSNDVWTLEKE